MKRLALVLSVLCSAASSSAQTFPQGIKADTVMERLMVTSQGSKPEAFSAVELLSDCSGYFGAFKMDLAQKRPVNIDAVEGLTLMQQDTSLVAVMIWSQHSTDPGAEVQLLADSSLETQTKRLRALGGTANVPWLQTYDECSQAFLFSEFMLGTAQDMAGSTGR